MKYPTIALLTKPIPHQVHAMTALDKCLRRAGYRTRLTQDLTAPEPVVFVWSWGKAMIVRSKNPLAIICCLDHAYTRHRAQFVNTGWSTPDVPTGLNGFAEHAVVDDGGVRLNEKGWADEMKPLRNNTSLSRALVLGQVYGDAMIVNQVEDYGRWLRQAVEDLQFDGWETTFRPHPVMVRRGNAKERYGNLGRESNNPDLWTDLSQNDLAVALNSNGLVAAYLEGMDVVAYNKGTMLSPLMNLPGSLIPVEHREHWFQRLAWTQWNLHELESGLWLTRHEPIMRRLVDGGTLRPWHEQKLPA